MYQLTLEISSFSFLDTTFFLNFKEVGTRLYIAPEVQSRKRGPRNHSKADMYSLGVRVSNLSLFELLLMSVKLDAQGDCKGV